MCKGIICYNCVKGVTRTLLSKYLGVGNRKIFIWWFFLLHLEFFIYIDRYWCLNR